MASLARTSIWALTISTDDVNKSLDITAKTGATAAKDDMSLKVFKAMYKADQWKLGADYILGDGDVDMHLAVARTATLLC
jgi:hypothetical protein